MDIIEKKKILYKEKPIAKLIISGDKSMVYKAETSKGDIAFEIPYEDMGFSRFAETESAQLLIRWIQ